MSRGTGRVFDQHSSQRLDSELKIKAMRLKLTHRLRNLFAKRDEWEYGTCNNRPARRHRVNGNVQFVLWKKGDQKYVDGVGHTEDKWVDYHRSWWEGFIPNSH